MVYHWQIFKNTSCLPVFNSNAIETSIHKIPGLSRYYAYFNDDFFLGQPLDIHNFLKEGEYTIGVETNNAPSCEEVCPDQTAEIKAYRTSIG